MFHLKFYQCFGCNGFGPYGDMEWDSFNRGFCTKECKKKYATTVYGYTPHRR